MTRDWDKDLREYETFLKNVDLAKYNYLRSIKTVEQDLPNQLLPLEIYYRYYWDSANFKDFEEVFDIYWNEKLSPYLYDFIRKYFYGCSLLFVEDGFRARLYRIWMSILTQFHFQYLWNAIFSEKIISSADLDVLGIDAIVNLMGKRIGFQVKKISFRREASQRRFTQRQQKFADIMVEIPYVVINIEKLKNKIRSSRTKESTRQECKNLIELFQKSFSLLGNGFCYIQTRVFASYL